MTSGVNVTEHAPTEGHDRACRIEGGERATSFRAGNRLLRVVAPSVNQSGRGDGTHPNTPPEPRLAAPPAYAASFPRLFFQGSRRGRKKEAAPSPAVYAGGADESGHQGDLDLPPRRHGRPPVCIGPRCLCETQTFRGSARSPTQGDDDGDNGHDRIDSAEHERGQREAVARPHRGRVLSSSELVEVVGDAGVGVLGEAVVFLDELLVRRRPQRLDGVRHGDDRNPSLRYASLRARMFRLTVVTLTPHCSNTSTRS